LAWATIRAGGTDVVVLPCTAAPPVAEVSGGVQCVLVRRLLLGRVRHDDVAHEGVQVRVGGQELPQGGAVGAELLELLDGHAVDLVGAVEVRDLRRKRLDDPRVDTLFDVMEFLHDHISTGVDGRYHDYSQCGWHYTTFTPEPARSTYRARVNELLNRTTTAYEMTPQGEIVRTVPDGIAPLLNSAPRRLPPTQRQHVEAAITKYRARSSTPTDRRDAVRDLADVLENLRDLVKEQMPQKDEAALFEIANKFWIRHNKPGERREYDHDAWWAWLFYVYLASIALVTHLTERDGLSADGDGGHESG